MILTLLSTDKFQKHGPSYITHIGISCPGDPRARVDCSRGIHPTTKRISIIHVQRPEQARNIAGNNLSCLALALYRCAHRDRFFASIGINPSVEGKSIAPSNGRIIILAIICSSRCCSTTLYYTCKLQNLIFCSISIDCG